ncbi:putative aspartate/glutamate racemase, partial [Polychaeton citri CBS 116435]
RTLALLGGMGYHATAVYYLKINERIQAELGGCSSASLLLYSFNHLEMQTLFYHGDWVEASARLTAAAKNLKAAGAEGFIICCNTAHTVAGQAEAGSGLPLWHIVDSVGRVIRNAGGVERIALLGTKMTMEGSYFTECLRSGFGLEPMFPEERQLQQVHSIVREELSRGIVTQESKDALVQILTDLISCGAQGVILGCTELQFALKPGDFAVPIWVTMEAHIAEASSWILQG